MEQVPGTEWTGEEERRVAIEKWTRGWRSGANWFYWIAGLSVVNSAIALFQGEWGFVVGLGITQFFQALAQAAGEQAGGVALVLRLLGMALALLAALVFVLFGWLANRGHGWAFVAGMVLYLLDGLIFLLVRDWLALGFHVFALFCIFAGYGALRKLREAQAPAPAESRPLGPGGA